MARREQPATAAALIARARTFLFVPASRPERFAKALGSGAHCVVLDLEDAVPPEEKSQARLAMTDRLEGFSPQHLARTLVRINAPETLWFSEDVRLAASWTHQGLAGVMVPKAEMPAQLHACARALGDTAQLVPLLESLAGLDAADLLARAPHVTRLGFGHLDFQLDVGMRCEADEGELAPVRFAVAAASRRAGLAPPIDGVTVDIGNTARLEADARRAKAMGFGAKLCIHPSQVALVDAVFAPSEVAVQWSRRVLEEAGKHQGKTFSLDGHMVDLPVVRLAQRTLEQAGGQHIG